MDDLSVIQKLLADLKNPEEQIRNQATAALWKSWFSQKGLQGLKLLQQAQVYLQNNQVEAAQKMLTDIVSTQPDFAEAWNQRAILYYSLKEYQLSVADCEQVVKLIPYHFGALHGMGLCQAALGNYREAILAFRRALEIQPYAVENQRLILECTARLS